MKQLLARSTLGALSAIAVIAGSSLPATASGRYGPTHPSPARAGTPRVSHHAVFSTYLAGYTVTPPVGVASDSATFKIPTLNCADNGGNQDGVLLGVGDETTKNAPTEEAGVFLLCNAATPEYFLDVRANGNAATLPTSPGDTVVASFYQTATTVTSIVHDLTGNVTWALDAPVIPDMTATTGAFPIYNNVQDLYPVPKFGVVTFSKCQLNGDYLGFAAPSQLNRQYEGEYTEISTSKLPLTSDTFKLTWRSL